MADLIIYDSSRAESLHTAHIAYMEYPAATLKDTKGLDMSTLDTWIGTLGDKAYGKIISCVNDTRVEEVLSTSVITFTHGGDAGDLGYITVDEGVVDPIPIGVLKSAAGTVTAAALLAKTSINLGTPEHGYTADNIAGVLTITAPAGTGVGAETFVLAIEVEGSLAATVTTQFGAGVTGVTAVGVLGDFSEEDFIDLEPKVLADAEDTGTVVAVGDGTHITLAATASAEDDYYNGMYVMILTNTGANQARRILDYVGVTQVAEIDYAWAPNPDGTSTYAISDDLRSYGRAYSNVNPPKRFWQDWFPNVMIPLFPEYVGGGTLYEKNDKTATGTAAGTLTDTGEFVSAAYDGLDYYCAIKSATTGSGQVRLIASNTANVLTLDKNWDVTPTGTVIYQIARKHILWDVYVPIIILTYFSILTDAQKNSTFSKMLDRYDDRSIKRTIWQDLATIDEYIELAKAIIFGIDAGVTVP